MSIFSKFFQKKPSPAEADNLFSLVPPTLYKDPDKIPRKHNKPFFVLTGDTPTDVRALQAGYHTVSDMLEQLKSDMDHLGLPPGNQAREALASKILGCFIVKEAYARTLAAIVPDRLPPPHQITSELQLKNAQYQIDLIFDLVTEISYYCSKGGSPLVSGLEEQLSDAQAQLLRIYRM